MNRFLIITRENNTNDIPFIRRLEDYIRQKNGECECLQISRQTKSSSIHIPEGTQGILTVGGDGTLIRAARKTTWAGLPFLGINCGHLGFLCDFNEETAFKAVDRLMNDDYETETRMMLTGQLLHADGTSEKSEHLALNDVVISSTNATQVIHIAVYVNGEFLYSFNGDGIIFSTPTGSTAYNLSAKGPIVDPATSMIVLTPLNPHTFVSSSIVFDSHADIRVELMPRRNNDQESASVCFDGSTARELKVGQSVHVRKADVTTEFIRLSRENFLERIRSRLTAE